MSQKLSLPQVLREAARTFEDAALESMNRHIRGTSFSTFRINYKACADLETEMAQMLRTHADDLELSGAREATSP